MALGISFKPVLTSVGHVGSGIILLEDKSAVAVQFSDGREKAVFEDVAISWSGDVANDDEGADDAVPADSSINMEGGWVSADVGVFDFTDFSAPLAVVSSIDLEFATDQCGVGTNDTSNPVFDCSAANEFGVGTAIFEVERLERDLLSADKEVKPLSFEIALERGGVHVVFLGGGSWFEMVDDDIVSCSLLAGCWYETAASGLTDDGVGGDNFGDTGLGEAFADLGEISANVWVGKAHLVHVDDCRSQADCGSAI